jgi:hypothetical protein
MRSPLADNRRATTNSLPSHRPCVFQQALLLAPGGSRVFANAAASTSQSSGGAPPPSSHAAVTADLHAGAQLCDSGSSSSSQMAQLSQLLSLKREHCRLQSELQALEDHRAAFKLVDSAALSATSDGLQRATTLLRQIVSDRAVLAVRLKDLNAKQTIAIEPHLQPQFLELLHAAAGSQARLEDSRQNLLWAVNFNDSPDTWERHLQALLRAVEECHLYHRQLTARAKALSELTTLQSCAAEGW